MTNAITFPSPWIRPGWWEKLWVPGLISLGLIMMTTITSNLFNADVTEVSALTYQEGGDPGDITDPALDVAPALRRYVCSNGGNDNNDGLTQASAWSSISKINSSWNSIPSNAIIVLCRGGTFAANSSVSNKAGTTNNPTAIGAYGACTASPFFDNMCSNAPRIPGDITFNGSSWITVRDLSARKWNTSFGSHDMVIYRNQGKGPEGNAASNVFKSFAESYHMVFVENIATDGTANDYFSAHGAVASQGGTANQDGWWFINNICLGNGAAEDCIDLANGELGQGASHVTLDSKVIVMRSIGQGLSGYSTLSGNSKRCMNSGHDGEYYWFVGIICVGFVTNDGRHWSFGSSGNFGPLDKRFAQISGSAFYDTTSEQLMGISVSGLDIYHNTAISNNGLPMRIYSNTRADTYNHINYNVFGQTSGGGGTLLDLDRAVTTMDNNWYGLNTSKSVISGQSLSQRQSQTSFDTNSNEGAIIGFSFPTAASYPNPNDWFKENFLNDITPSQSWAGCDGANTPGARDCNGNWLGWEINEIAGAPNGGCGWEGLPIVAVKLAELGVTGDCV